MNTRQNLSQIIAPIVARNAALQAQGLLPKVEMPKRVYSVPPDNIKAPGAYHAADGIAFVAGYDKN